jgi:hypothetical protein
VNDTFEMTIAATPYTVTITAGVYACALTLLAEVAAEIVADTPVTTCNAYLSASNSGYAYMSFNQTATVTTSALLKLLGFTSASYAGVTTMSADMFPESMWVPTYQTTDQGRWFPKQDDLVFGVNAKDGSLVGRTSGPIVYYRALNFIHESAANIFENGNAESSEALKRCLDYWARGAMRSYPAGSTNPATRGFYFFEDINDAMGTATWADTSMGSNGIYSDNTYTFSTFDVGGYGAAIATTPTGRNHYGVSFTINTASTSTWQTPA